MTIILQTAVVYFGNLLELLILARVLSSWFPVKRENNIIRWLFVLTEPILGPIRAILRKTALGAGGMMVDFSPFAACIVIEFGKYVLTMLIGQVGLLLAG